jgi:hypothetical protein
MLETGKPERVGDFYVYEASFSDRAFEIRVAASGECAPCGSGIPKQALEVFEEWREQHEQEIAALSAKLRSRA